MFCSFQCTNFALLSFNVFLTILPKSLFLVSYVSLQCFFMYVPINVDQNFLPFFKKKEKKGAYKPCCYGTWFFFFPLNISQNSFQNLCTLSLEGCLLPCSLLSLQLVEGSLEMTQTLVFKSNLFCEIQDPEFIQIVEIFFGHPSTNIPPLWINSSFNH